MLVGAFLARRRIGRPFIPVGTCRGHIGMLGLGSGRAGNGIKCSLRVHGVDRGTVGKRVLPSEGGVDEDHAADRALMSMSPESGSTSQSSERSRVRFILA
jgi:hypothetical protein